MGVRTEAPHTAWASQAWPMPPLRGSCTGAPLGAEEPALPSECSSPRRHRISKAGGESAGSGDGGGGWSDGGRGGGAPSPSHPLPTAVTSFCLTTTRRLLNKP